MPISTTSWILGAVPFASGFILPPIVSKLFGMKTTWTPSCDETRKCKLRPASSPPAYVFWVMWTALYVLLGVTWAWARESSPEDAFLYDILFAVMVFLLFVWTLRYSGGKHMKELVLTLYLNVAYVTTVWSVLLVKQSPAAITLTPLVTWLAFALQLSVAETNFYLEPKPF